MSEHIRVRKVLLSSILCLLTLLIVACGGPTPQANNADQEPAPASQQVFRFPIGPEDFQVLDPALSSMIVDNQAISIIFTGLITLDRNLNIIDQMAQSHSISSDGITYTFKLKPNLKFSDGTPLKAQDIAYSINRALSPAIKSPTATFLDVLKDWDKMITGKIPTLIGDSLIVKDENTLVFVLAHPASYFLQTLAGSTIALPVNKKLIDKYGSKWTEHLAEGGGSGPFKVAQYDHNKGLTLVPNTNYYGPIPKLQKLEMLRSGDTDTTYKGYQTGQLDYATVPLTHLSEVKNRKDFQHSPELLLDYVEMNYLAKPFDNIKIRQAFALAVNKDLIAEKVMRGSVTPTNHLMPEGMPGLNKDLSGPAGVKSTKGDPAKAKQLLQEGMQEEGYASVSQLPPLIFTYSTGSTDIANIVAVLVQQWQTVLGVTVKSSVVSGEALSQQWMSTIGNSGPLQIWLMGMGNYPDPQGWVTFNFGKGASFNFANYGQNKSKNAAAQQAVQEELQKADINLNPQERTQQYNDAEQKIVNDVGWLTLFQGQFQLLINPKLRNYPVTPLGFGGFEPDAWGNIYMAK
ncbi:peptide ABC transporter substrate-binding protein [Ktedonosporobacter rubrisoli]|uniref:Peptide ABC transporter substrate-binding protein n=1 Tax=Ktedonosporobacter rubrisoli TaxID=2509675 RepID=A0A4P6JP65_KTERU|nr:peptide ABC transporter substrate-binding protein [Ktedonosporobacter rubrisoli]QBD76983.1 peptide ABC transporter substrate-binding protein [Ktedonosporobacter rubrisoli]